MLASVAQPPASFQSFFAKDLLVKIDKGQTDKDKYGGSKLTNKSKALIFSYVQEDNLSA